MAVTKSCPDAPMGLGTTLANAATRKISLTQSDTTELLAIATKIVVSVTGDVAVTLANDFSTSGANKIVIPNVPVGVLEGFAIRQLWNTGTTATVSALAG